MRFWKIAVPFAVLASGVLPAQAAGDKTVEYRGYQVTVPADWPVVDLAKDPTACVRYDRPAVYVGKSTAQPDCPSNLTGRSEGLVLEPLTKAARSTPGELQKAVSDAGVLATAYYNSGGVQAAQQLLDSGRVTSKTNQLAQPRAAAVTPSIVATGSLQGGFAFDACTAPSQAAMDGWLYPSSGYKAVGIYLSGERRACAQPNLTPDWVGTNAAKGWQFLLIDVGLQAPCTTFSSKMSTDAATARAQGRTAAANAVVAAQNLGFAQRSAIYSDIENYAAAWTAACKASVLSYISGWTTELNTRGYVSGVYASVSSGVKDLSDEYNNTAYTRPDNLWFAHWNKVTNTTSDRFPAAYWSNRQRVHQYDGPHDETHGGVKISIDSNAVNLTAPPAALTGFDATGAYSTAALKWTVPAGNQVIVRRNAGGTTPPPLPNVGTAVYTGTAASTTATGLANATSYAFRAWAKDSTGKIGPGVDTVLIGTGATVAASAPAISYGGAVTLYTRATRKDSGASLTGVPLSLYARAKNSATWREVAKVTSDGTGQASSVQKPTVSTVYAWGYNGSPDLLGSRSGNATIEVKPTITVNLATAIKLGTTTPVYGFLRPQHPGTTAYLQRLTGTAWPTVATTKLNATGNYGFSIKPAARGTSYYRVVWLADADHATTVSSTKAVTVG